MEGESGLEERHVFQLQQTMLGALRRYDPEDTHKIHPASLQRALDSLGLSFGDELVDKMMVMCQSDSEGMVDYSRFYRYLNRGAESARASSHITQAREKLSIHATLTDGQQSLQPFEDVHGASAEERQRNLIQDARGDLMALFERFDNKELSVGQFKQELRDLGLVVTPALDRVLLKTSGTDVAFKDVRRALSQVTESGDVGQVAGHVYAAHTQKDHHMTNEGTFGKQGLTRRRTDPFKNSATFGRSEEVGHSKKAFTNKAKKGQVGNLMASPELVDAMFGGPRTKPCTQARADMVAGIGRNSTDKLSSEQRVLRQQIFAAIRRMDKGELSAAQFKDRMMQIGVEIPPDVFKLMLQHRASGAATFNTFASAFERLLEEREAERGFGSAHEMEDLLAQLRQDLLRRGQPLVLQRLAQNFKSRDLLNDGSLVLPDFADVLKQVWPTMTDDQCVALFNNHDPEGVGKALYMTFVQTIRGDISEDRLAVVRQAFLALPKDARGNVVAEDLHSSFHAAAHPDVTSGKKTRGQIITEFLDTFEVGSDGASVSQAEFEDYYRNISAVMASTEEYVSLIKNCWGMDETVEPPPVHFYKSFHSGKYTEAPMAAQTHGNILNWRQAAGELEIKNQTSRPPKTLLGDHVDAHQSVNFKVNEWAQASDAIQDEFEGQYGRGRGAAATSKRLQRGNLAVRALTWDARPNARNGAPPPPPNAGDPSAPPPAATEEGGTAGAVLREHHPLDVRPRVMSDLARHHHGVTTPFGVNDPVTATAAATGAQPAAASGAGKAPKVMSLKDHFRAASAAN